MTTYERNGNLSGAENQGQEGQQGASQNPKEPQGYRVNGFQQVLEMLAVADPEFRESLLRRLAAQDPNLAQALRTKLGY